MTARGTNKPVRYAKWYRAEYTFIYSYLQNFSIEGGHQVMNEHIAVVRIYIQVKIWYFKAY